MHPIEEGLDRFVREARISDIATIWDDHSCGLRVSDDSADDNDKEIAMSDNNETMIKPGTYPGLERRVRGADGIVKPLLDFTLEDLASAKNDFRLEQERCRQILKRLATYRKRLAEGDSLTEDERRDLMKLQTEATTRQ